MMEFRNITPDSPESVTFGPETTLKSERIGATTETVDNVAGDGDVEVDFSDLFSKEDSKETSHDKSAGGSVKVSIESEQDVEGIASFKEAVETEAHAESLRVDGHVEQHRQGGHGRRRHDRQAGPLQGHHPRRGRVPTRGRR